jgi:hypothetical protein
MVLGGLLLSDTILKGTIPASFGLIWFSGFWEDLNVIFYQNMPNLHNQYKSLVECSLGGPPWKLCPVIPTSNQDGRQAKNRKKEGWNLKKIFSSETTEPISTC